MSREIEQEREVGCGSSDVSRIASDANGCARGGFKLFGVCLTANSPPSAFSSCASMRKSFSMGNLSNYGPSTDYGFSSIISPQEQPDLGTDLAEGSGYASDDLVHSNTRERKKGVPWTEEEHRSFLLGLLKLGKGDWRGISQSFVKSRTPTQVASHAQKYFLRRNNLNKRRRRSSLFDITPDSVSTLLEESVLEEAECEDVDACQELMHGQNISGCNGLGGDILLGQMYHPDREFMVQRKSRVGSGMQIDAPVVLEEGEGANSSSRRNVEDKDIPHPIPALTGCTGGGSICGGSLLPSSCTTVGFWPLSSMPATSASTPPFLWSCKSNLVRPTPLTPTPAKIDDRVKLVEMTPVMQPSPLSHKLLEEGSRHSAFHTMPSSGTNNSQGTASNAISVP